jgi:hypothetical protein
MESKESVRVYVKACPSDASPVSGSFALTTTDPGLEPAGDCPTSLPSTT